MTRALRFEGTADESLVLLPAVRSRPEDVVDAGFVVTGHRPRLILADVPVQALGDTPDPATLLRDLVAPELEAGRRTTLAGLSLGGWLALQIARIEPRLAGVGLIAPWLGARTEPSAEERATWDYLAAPTVPVWLGFGEQDRFADAQRRAAALLPQEDVKRVAGGHDWRCWRQLWEHFLTWVPR